MIDPDAALAVTGLERATVLDLVADLEAEDVFLVGSLAAGLGNARSDVDVHLFEPDGGGTPDGAQVVLFAGATLVDVQIFSVSSPGRLAGVATAAPSVPFGAGRCSLASPPPGGLRQRLGLWRTACPLSDSAALFDEEVGTAVDAVLTRHALEVALRSAATAALLEASGVGAQDAWRVAGRALCELVAVTHGDVLVTVKWTWAKARRADLGSVVAQAAAVVDQASWRDAAVAVGLSEVDLLALVGLKEVSAPRVELAGGSYLLVGQRRLVRRVDVDDVRLTDDRARAADLMRVLAEGAVEVAVDDEALRGFLVG